ncbi:M50 family metallopeptidase [Methylobacterium sp. 092160098-2]|uniref:M50 family metallopeptidase n=1 Tax=Methylobacterium sp. 092160098-2 TaxID=3025129 RepID=UPI002381AB57|nr:M50 family metallopeptidase [Methylobacterium sp. 092160098-2]MDE4914932.1 M50 family metallopeptidase [Methylobacterium sp. 092160098-2]
MTETILAILGYVVMMSAVIGFHEFGHYAAGRLLGIQPVEFALGFGRILLSRTDRNGCRWSVRAVPMGGFVKFLGDGDIASASSVAVAPGLRRRTLDGAGPARRAVVAFAGPLANFVLTFLLLTGLYAGVGRVYTPALVQGTVAGSAAEKAGFLKGDLIVAVDGVSIDRFEDTQALVMPRAGMPTRFEVLRDGASVALEATPAATLVEDNFGRRHEIGRIGLFGGKPVFERVPVASAFLFGLSDMVFQGRQMLGLLRETVLGERPVNQLAGPARIAEAAGDAIRGGWANLLFLAAFISINLGIVNLLPIPLMDGGLLVFCGLEGLRGRPLGARAQKMVNLAGMAAVGGLMVTVVANDVLYLIHRS